MPRRSIRKGDPVPYYIQLADILRDRISRGDWPPGELLPSEAELGDSYEVSRTAVRQALDLLVADGMVTKEKGRGTFVSRTRSAPFVANEIHGLFEEMSRRGRHVDTEILAQQVTEAAPDVASALRVKVGGSVIRLDRLRRIDGDPAVIATTHLPAARFDGLVDIDLSAGTLYGALAHEFGIHPTGGTRRFEAVPADQDLAERLGVAAGVPLLQVTAITVDEDDVPFEHFVAWYRGDVTAFDITVGPAAATTDAIFDFRARRRVGSR